MSQKELLIICTFFRPRHTGAGIFIEKLCNQLHATYGVNCTILTIQWEPSATKEYKEGLTIHRLPIPLPYRYRIQRGIFRFFSYVVFMLWVFIRILFTGFRYQSILCMDTNWTTVSASLAAWPYSKKVFARLSMIKGKTPDYWKSSPLGRLRLAILRQRVQIILTNPVVLDEFIQAGFKESQIALVPNGVDTALFGCASENEKRELRLSLDLPLEVPICVYLGGIVPWKGIDLLPETWSIVLTQIPTAQLVLVGSIHFDQPYLSEFSRAISAWAETTSSVKLIGEVAPTKSASYLRAADLFLFPSKAEGMPNALLEAMSCGLACVITPFLGLSDFIGRNEQEFVVVDDSPQALASNIIEILASPKVAYQLGQQARQQIEQKFDIKIIVKNYARLLKLNHKII